MSENIYQTLFEASQEESRKATQRLFSVVGKSLKADLGPDYFEFIDYLVLEDLKNAVDSLESFDDNWETPDNKARDLAAAYRMVEYRMRASDYKAYVEERRELLRKGVK